MINNEKQYELIKFEDGEFSLDVNVSLNEETVWLNKQELSLLFARDRTVISRHIKNILLENELDSKSVSANFAHTALDGKTYNVEYFNLDMILAVGYRVNSHRGILFRKWATNILKNYLIKGYSINEKRCLNCEDSILSMQNKINSITNEIDLIKNKISPLSDSSYFNTKLILNNEIYEAISFLKQLLNKALNRLIIIDGYINVETLDLLIDIKIPITIYTLPSANITNRDIHSFNINHNLTVIQSSKVHNRFIIIDTDLYSIGSSLKDCGKKLTTINKLETININDIINNL